MWSIEARQQLHRHVLEGERRPVEELEQPQVWLDLDQRRNGGMVEGGIGFSDHARQVASGISPPTNGWIIATATSA